MPVSRFSSAVTVEDWASELTTLLGEVEGAVESGEFAKKLELQDLLFEFVKTSPASAEALDAIARRAAEDLLRSEVQEAVAGIAARNAELEEATERIRQGTAVAKGAAKELQFEKVAESLESARAGIEALRALGEGLGDDDAALTDRLVEIAGAIEDFQKLAGQTVGKTRSVELSAEPQAKTRGVVEKDAPKSGGTRSPAKRKAPAERKRRKTAPGGKAKKPASGRKKSESASGGKTESASRRKKTGSASRRKKKRSTGKRKPAGRSTESSG